MISRQVAALSAAAVLGVAALAGCSSSAKTGNAAATGSASPAASTATGQTATNAGLTDAALLTAFKAAAAKGTALHVKGAMTASGSAVTLDLQLNKAAGTASGTVSADGATIPIISVGGVTYVQFTPSVIKMAGVPASLTAAVSGKWVSSKSSIGSNMASGFASFANYDAFISSITANDGSGAVDKTTPAGTTTYNGQTVAVYKSSDGSEAYFAANGPAYLLEIINTSSSEAGTMIFTWNQPTTVTAPSASEIYTG